MPNDYEELVRAYSRPRDYWLVTLEFPTPARTWQDGGPEHERYLELGGEPADWLAFRLDLAANDEAYARIKEIADRERAELTAAGPREETYSVPVCDSAAHRAAVAEWFFLGRHLERQACSRSVGNGRPLFSPWPSFDQRLRGEFRHLSVDGQRFARGDFDGKYGRFCCHWTEDTGCRWYPYPRCSLKTRQVVQPFCRHWRTDADGVARVHGQDWDLEAVRRVFEWSADEQAVCLDPEGFLRPGRECATCPDRLDRLLYDDEPDPTLLEEVS